MRQLGMGVGPIPWMAIRDYADYLEIDDDCEFLRFETIIQAMDGAYLRHVEQKMKKK